MVPSLTGPRVIRHDHHDITNPSQEDTVNGNATATLPVVEDTHIPVGSLVTVTIGRNVGTTPMSDAVWAEFRNQVTTVLRTISDDVFGPFDGYGEWEGVTEESTTFTALTVSNSFSSFV